ncbi:MAG: PD-(D/E)XK nuclease family protein [Muribaculaceae bacterium]|nr:PD-(D/E)XK nuclease family protein [Muribaculaceae bacterium]
MKNSEPSLREENRVLARPFLESVARAYYDNFDDLSDFCFVFPNKRAGTFFLKHLQQAARSRTLIAPKVTSITDFVAELADHDVASRIELLFRLYTIYRNQKEEREEREERGEREEEREERVIERVIERREEPKGELLFSDFDSFRNWGETLLSDFSEVDQYNVDADSLFKNVKDYREIASSFLTEEQIAVMERYFGYAPGLWEVERFWKNMTPPSDIKNKFLLLWQQMAPLYHALNKSLSAERLCTSGGAYRLGLQRLQIHGRKILPWKKVVIVGFNALSTTEALIFEELKRERPEEGIKGDYAEFFWDGTGPVLSEAKNDAASFLKYNRKNFPSPEWAENIMRESDTSTMPESMTAIGAPSNSAQGKVAGAKISELLEERKEEELHEAKVAVVLPDENLLMPFLYSLPERLNAVNLTMGYSLRITSVMSFVNHLRRVRSTQRNVGDDIAFYHEDLRLFLSHPYIHALAGSKVVSSITGYINKHHLVAVTLSDIARFSEPTAEVLRKLDPSSTVLQIIDYLEEVLVRISAALDSKEAGVLKSRIDRSHIEVYRDALHRLSNACEEHKIEMSMNSVFSMVEKLLAGEQVTFEGEPLEGLQVMGLLETRALDFDRLIILSMNDRVMPRKASGRTFIPDSLRHGYGLPYSNYREDLFSYYFYRMISRAREVTMIYDARASSGMRSGGMSRYLMQLRYLYAPETLKFENHKFLLTPATNSVREIEKTDMVMAQLERFTERGSRRNFSASALRNYFICPVKFYYENIVGLRTESEPDEYIDAIGVGNVLHEVMFHIYFPEGKRRIYLDDPILMTPEKIKALQEDKETIHMLVTEAVNRNHFNLPDEKLDRPLEGAAAMIGAKIESQIQDVLGYDLTLAPFELIGGEISGLVEWPLPQSEKKVNMKYAIDRLDRVTGSDGSKIYRIVDYKTGSAAVKAKSMDSVFDADKDAKNMFQLMLYANLMNRDRGTDEPVKLAIYEISELGKTGEVTPTMADDPEAKKPKYVKLETHFDHNEEFLERTDEVLHSIFDSEQPFTAADDDEKCKYCNLAHLCGRRE